MQRMNEWKGKTDACVMDWLIDDDYDDDAKNIMGQDNWIELKENAQTRKRARTQTNERVGKGIAGAIIDKPWESVKHTWGTAACDGDEGRSGSERARGERNY